MEPGHLRSMLASLDAWGQNPSLAEASAQAVKANAEFQAARHKQIAASTGGAVAVLPLQGCITQKSSWMSYYFGGTTTEGFTMQFRQALADPNVTAIVIDVDSPGGSVAGVDELAAEIRAARGKKTIVGISNTLNASAAFYLSSQVSELWAMPSSLTGSVGVYSTHTDLSGYMEQVGVKVTFISAGKFKVEGNPYEPMDEVAQAAAQKLVDGYYDQFVSALAKGRGKKKGDVQAGFGEGRVVMASEALTLGMIDQVGTFDDLLAKFGVKRTGNEGPYAAAESTTVVGKKADEVNDNDEDDGDDTDGDGCDCACTACASGDCSGCTVDDCDVPTCQCPASTKNRDDAKAEHDHKIALQLQRMRLDLDK